MSKEISSIDWLIEKYTIVLGLGSKELMKEHIERARQMHAKEIIEANIAGMEFIPADPNHYTEDAEEYYKNKFA